MQLPKIPFVVLDTETTGFIPKVNRVIEYAHVVYRDGTEAESYDQLIAIPGEIPDVVQVITRIKPDALSGKPVFENLRDDIAARIGSDTLIVGQNVSFDINMLRGEGIDLSHRSWVDTSMLASLVFPELESYSLGYISKVLKLQHEPVHRAMGDVHATLELFSRCWERLLELPQEMLLDLKTTFHKSEEGYRILADALPTGTAKSKPAWIAMPDTLKFPGITRALPLPKPAIGTVDLIEEPLDPMFLQCIVDAAAKDTSTTHWIAVKNLTSTIKRLKLGKNVCVLQPPFLLLDHEAAEHLRAQEKLSADEATLLLKLDWYAPTVLDDAPIHGGEKAVWNGKLACTDTSATYLAQFMKLPSVILLDHRQLLHFVQDPDHAAHHALTTDAHIIIDDASMLEDTASKAYGWYCGMGDLRAAAAGNARLTKLTDLLQIWMEKIRNEQDVRYIAPNDLESSEVASLRAMLTSANDGTLRPQTVRLLESVGKCLEPEAATRISWIETHQDGSQFLRSVPESVAELLQRDLFSKYPVSLAIPPSSAHTMPEAVHRNVKTAINPFMERVQDAVTTEFPETLFGKNIIADPPDGKTILLAGSRRVIEEYFIRYAVDLEARGVTLICQNLSGGMNRMQAEFLAADAPAVWVLTPWTFESVELPPGTVDHLIVDALPFDNPSQPVFAKRAEHFTNAFIDYSMPRLLQRLFRLLRTFRCIATLSADVTVIDTRIREKKYGKDVRAYMELCTEKGKKNARSTPRGGDFPENWQMNLF